MLIKFVYKKQYINYIAFLNEFIKIVFISTWKSTFYDFYQYFYLINEV